MSCGRARSPSTHALQRQRHAVDLGRIGLGDDRDAQRARRAARQSLTDRTSDVDSASMPAHRCACCAHRTMTAWLDVTHAVITRVTQHASPRASDDPSPQLRSLPRGGPRELVPADARDPALGRPSLLPPQPHQPGAAPGERDQLRDRLRAVCSSTRQWPRLLGLVRVDDHAPGRPLLLRAARATTTSTRRRTSTRKRSRSATTCAARWC